MACARARVHAHVHAHAYTHAHNGIRKHMHAYARTHACMHTHAHLPPMSKETYYRPKETYSYRQRALLTIAYLSILRQTREPRGPAMRSFTSTKSIDSVPKPVCVRICMYVCMCVHVCVYVCACSLCHALGPLTAC